jgi:hypothetical protein
LAGFSRGARVAAELADSLGAEGLLCFGYPFHAPREAINTERVRLFASLKLPTMLCQGTRDPHGNRDQVKGYDLPDNIELTWLEGAKHRLDGELLSSPAGQAALGRAAQFVRALV